MMTTPIPISNYYDTETTTNINGPQIELYHQPYDEHHITNMENNNMNGDVNNMHEHDFNNLLIHDIIGAP